MRYADVTMTDGRVVSPVAIYQDQYGLRFYSADKGRVSLLGTIPGGTIRDWGTKVVDRDPVTNVRTAVRRSAVITGDLPADFATVAYRGGCQCGSAVKNYRPPTNWEVDA